MHATVRCLHAPPARLGRRGAILLLVGVAWTLQGVGILAQAWAPIALPVLHEWIPTPIRAAMWLAPGAVALACAWRRHPGDDTPGYIAAVGVPVFMTASWVIGLILNTAGHGLMRGLISASTWAIVAAMFYTVSGWAETPDGFVPPEQGGGPGEDVG